MSEPRYAPSELPYAPSELPYQPPPWAAPPLTIKKRKTWLIVVVLATISLLLLIGGVMAITGSTINAVDEALSETSASLEPESSSPSPEPTTESSDEPDGDTGPVKIGQSFTYEDGLKVSVVSAKKDTAGQDPIEGRPGDPTAIITVKITNGTAKKFAAGDVWLIVTYGTYGEVASDQYEFNGFVGTISSGRSKMAKYEFLVEDKEGLNDLVIEVNPSFDHDSAIFEGAAK
jgi:hypothetical protein